MIIDNISGNRWLVNALEKGQLSIKKLRQLFGITTESFENRKKRNGLPSESSISDPNTSLGQAQEAASDTSEANATPLMEALRAYLLKQELEFEPNGVAGKAIAYMLNRWTN